MANQKPKHPLRKYREACGLTQAELGKELGVWDITISRWETGRRKIDERYLLRVRRRTGLSLAELRPDLAPFIGGQTA